MQIVIEKVVQKLYLSDYAAEYGDKALQVWVNPSRKILQERIAQAEQGKELRSELDGLAKGSPDLERMRVILDELGNIGKISLAWMSEILSQGTEDTHISADELTAFVNECEELDPGFYAWISKRVWEMIGDHRLQKKKA